MYNELDRGERTIDPTYCEIKADSLKEALNHIRHVLNKSSRLAIGFDSDGTIVPYGHYFQLKLGCASKGVLAQIEKFTQQPNTVLFFVTDQPIWMSSLYGGIKRLRGYHPAPGIYTKLGAPVFAPKEVKLEWYKKQPETAEMVTQWLSQKTEHIAFDDVVFVGDAHADRTFATNLHWELINRRLAQKATFIEIPTQWSLTSQDESDSFEVVTEFGM